jgi:hypothetical protein
MVVDVFSRRSIIDVVIVVCEEKARAGFAFVIRYARDRDLCRVLTKSEKFSEPGPEPAC